MARTPEQEAEYQALVGEAQASAPTGRSPEQEAEYQALLSEQPSAAPSEPRLLEAAKSGLTGTAETSRQLLNKIDVPSRGLGAGVNLAKGLLNKVLPVIGPSPDFQPQGVAEYATQFATGLADVPGMIAGGLVTKAAAPVIRGVVPKLGTLGQQVAKHLEVASVNKELGLVNETKQAADAAYKSFFAKRAIEGAAEGAVESAVTSGAQSYAQGDSPSVLAMKSLLGGGVGAALGGTIGAGSARFSKSGFTNVGKGFSEKVLDTRTPAIIALEERIAEGQAALEKDKSLERVFTTKIDYPEIANMAPQDFEARLVFQVVDPDQLVHTANNAADAKKLARSLNGEVRLGVKNDSGAVIPINPRSSTDAPIAPDTSLPSPEDKDAFQLLEKIRETQSFDPAKTFAKKTEATAKLSELEEAQRKLIFQGRKVSTEKVPDIFKQQTQTGAVENARAQADKVFQLGKEGLIPEDQVSVIAKAEFDNALDKQFANRDGFHSVEEGTWRLGHEAANKIDEVLGTNLSGAHQVILNSRTAAKNLIQQLNTDDAAIVKALGDTGLGVEGEMVSIMRYIETDPATGVPFLNPTPSNNPLNTRPAYDGPVLTPQQLDLFSQLRQRLDSKRAQYQTEVGDIGQVPGYIPIRAKEQVVSAKKGVESTLQPKAAQAREDGFWDPTIHETNMMKILQGYNSEVGRAIALKPAIDEGLKQAQLLQLLGDEKGLSFWKRQLADSFGISKTRDLEDMFGQKVYKDLEPQLLKVIAKSGDPELMKAELLREMSKAFYTNKVLLNAKNQMLQFFQPELVGFGEIGTYASKGRIPDTETAKAVDEMLKLAYHSNTGSLEDFGSALPKGKAAKAIALVNTPGKIIGGGIQNASERQNRRAILGGAYMQWRDAFEEQGIAGLSPLLERLLPGQRAAIQETFQKKGQEAAKRHYAVITSDRANFSYDLINRPQALRNEVGNNIPFLTFGLNSLERLATDAKGLQAKQLARRFAPAIVASYVISLATKDKRELKGIDPISSSVGVLSPNINPVISTAVDVYQQRDPGQALGKLAGNILPVEPVKGIYDTATKRKWGENSLNALGLKKKKKKDWFDSLVRDVKRTLR